MEVPHTYLDLIEQVTLEECLSGRLNTLPNKQFLTHLTMMEVILLWPTHEIDKCFSVVLSNSALKLNSFEAVALSVQNFKDNMFVLPDTWSSQAHMLLGRMVTTTHSIPVA